MIRLSALSSQVSDLIARIKRLTAIARRTKLELEDNPRLHLNPCAMCKVVLTRYGTCASCEMKSNGKEAH